MREPEHAAVVAAACWVRDGLSGRHESGSAALLKKSRWDRLAHDLRTSEGWETLLLVAGIALCALIFVEEPLSVRIEDTCDSRRGGGLLALAIELAALVLYWMDLLMKRGKLKGWHRMYFGATVLLSVDALIALACAERPFRLLRPLLIGLRVKEQRRILQGVLHLFKRQLGLALGVTVSGVLLAGALGAHLFGSTYDDALPQPPLRGTFESMLPASLEIWVLVSSAGDCF